MPAGPVNSDQVYGEAPPETDGAAEVYEMPHSAEAPGTAEINGEFTLTGRLHFLLSVPQLPALEACTVIVYGDAEGSGLGHVTAPVGELIVMPAGPLRSDQVKGVAPPLTEGDADVYEMPHN